MFPKKFWKAFYKLKVARKVRKIEKVGSKINRWSYYTDDGKRYETHQQKRWWKLWDKYGKLELKKLRQWQVNYSKRNFNDPEMIDLVKVWPLV